MNKMLKVILTITLTLGLLITGCSSEPAVARVGEPAPDFQLQDLDGQTISLSDFRGRPVLLNFWATGCIPCRSEMSYIQEIYQQHSDTSSSSLVVLTINPGESHSTVEEFMDFYHLSLPVLFDTKGVVWQGYNIQYIPTTFLIYPDGTIREKVIGAFPSKAAIENRLALIMP